MGIIEKRKVMLLFRIMIVLVALLAISTITNQILTRIEQNEYKAPGALVKVDGKNMHVFSAGSGDKTIVMMSGLGTSSPVIDFSPLIKELSKSYKVVVVENFGYGWSDRTDKPRTTENIVHETRTALKKAGIKPPYILMPHSISGFYSLYYANKYPNEVQAVVGIDPSVPKQFDYLPDSSNNSASFYFISFLRQTGIIRIVSKISPSVVPPQAKNGEYTDEQLKLYRMMILRNAVNKTVIDENNRMKANGMAIYNMSYPKETPVLQLLSKQNGDYLKDVYRMDWLNSHQELIHGVDNGKCVVLPGAHYLHWTAAKQMAEDTKFFLDTIDVQTQK